MRAGVTDAKPPPVMDWSKSDFAALAAKFKESKHKNTDFEVLKDAICARREGFWIRQRTEERLSSRGEANVDSALDARGGGGAGRGRLPGHARRL